MLEVKSEDSASLGFSYGEKCRERILSTIGFYGGIFNKTEEEIFARATHFKQMIAKFDQEYCSEIEGIARGAQVDPLWIYALNARSEILDAFYPECSAVFLKNSGILGQNWDWSQRLENLAVLLRITKGNGHRILTVTEPGIIGKIGLNSKGVGVCLNFVNYSKPATGVPIHILLRSVLDSSSVEEAATKIRKYGFSTNGNILIADKRGDYVNFELSSDHLDEIRPAEAVYHHTNHYLGSNPNALPEELQSSFSRYKQISRFIAENAGNLKTVDDLKTILLDQQNPELPICRKYIENPFTETLGTVCSIVMNLKSAEMNISLGNPFEYGFKAFKV